MKVLVYGDAAPGSGGWCYAETLRDMGNTVAQVQDADSAGLNRVLPKRLYRKIFKRLPESDRRAHVASLFREADRFRPDIVIVQKGLHLSGEDISALRRAGHWVCNINHDDFFSANPNNWSLIQREAIPAYDYIFTTRAVNVNEVRPLNTNVEFFPFAYYPRIHHRVEMPAGEEKLWETDVVFVGTFEEPRAATLEYLIAHTSCLIAIHGSQWSKLPRSSKLRDRVRSADLRFDSLCKALGGARISLGFLRKENRDEYTQRTFEIPACGGLLLAERTDAHASYFREGTEAEFFDPDRPDELVDKVQRLLKDTDRREHMRVAGRDVVLNGHHTYRDRLERLLQLHRQK